MKYILLIISSFYFSMLYAQVDTDSLVTTMLSSIEYTTTHDSSHKHISENELQPFLNLYHQMKSYDNFHTPNFDFYNQFQLLNEYSFTTPSFSDTIPLTFSTYHLKKNQKLESLRNLAFKQKEALLKCLRDAQTPDSPEIAAFRTFLGIANNFVFAVLLYQKLK